jgi:hypothetical protein
MLCSLWTDLTGRDVQCSECLYGKKTEWEIQRKATYVTLFCCRALARCCAPSSPIQLCERFSVVSTYVKQKAWEIRPEKVAMLHCLFVKHGQGVVLLVDRSHCGQVSLWWVSMWNRNNERFDEKLGMLHCFVVKHWQDVLLLHHRFDCTRGWVWWVSTWKKNSKRFDEKLRMLHGFLLDHCEGVVLLEGRSNCSRGWVWWVSMWNETKRD